MIIINLTADIGDEYDEGGIIRRDGTLSVNNRVIARFPVNAWHAYHDSEEQALLDGLVNWWKFLPQQPEREIRGRD